MLKFRPENASDCQRTRVEETISSLSVHIASVVGQSEIGAPKQVSMRGSPVLRTLHDRSLHHSIFKCKLILPALITASTSSVEISTTPLC